MRDGVWLGAKGSDGWFSRVLTDQMSSSLEDIWSGVWLHLSCSRIGWWLCGAPGASDGSDGGILRGWVLVITQQ